MPELVPVLTPGEIEHKVSALAESISHDYEGGGLVLVGVLKGAFIFLADLARKLTIPIEIDFIGVSSYGSDTESRGTLTFTKELDLDVKGKDVLLVEDIVDTGLTLTGLVRHFQELKPRSVRTCAMIDKPERRKEQVDVDYVGSRVSEGFLVGYGLDCAERYRNLPGVYEIRE
ncbi:MAG: hypoxanthine phosphoribosyltransferase [Desulfatibacillaceae bacterium]